ncbi:MAG TPA: hypothetical protein VMW46_03195 [Candidatus Desulfaltia sp.]|nr:hypothetical protein [Candidatus Desulfaltia sp.]
MRGVGDGNYDYNLGGWVYNDSDESANVRVGIRTWINKKTRTYEPVLTLEVLSPTQIGLQGIVIGQRGSDSNLNSCGFPNTQGDVLQCWEMFLNQPQPQAGYQRAQFQHYGDRCMTEEEADFNNMGIGNTKVMHLSLLMQGQDIMGTCDECDPGNYHQVNGYAHGYDKDNGTYDISLTRESLDTWRVSVDIAFDNPNYSESFPDAFSWHDDKIWESYCECVSAKDRKRTVVTKSIRESSWVRAPISYEMLFIRTPK